MFRQLKKVGEIVEQGISAATFDWRKAIRDAQGFGDILAVFDRLLLATEWSFDKFERKLANTQKVRTAIAKLEAGGTSDPESSYLALSRIMNSLYGSDIKAKEQEEIVGRYREEYAGMPKKLLRHYTTTGKDILGATGCSGDMVELKRLQGERMVLEAQLRAALKAVDEEFIPQKKDAHTQYVSPLLEKKMQREQAYRTEKENIVSRHPGYYSANLSTVGPETLSGYMECKRLLDENETAFRSDNMRLARECTEAVEKYYDPICDAEYKKRAKIVNENKGSSDVLQEKSNAAAVRIHSNLLSHLLAQSPVTEEDAQRWISDNAIMNSKAVAKAKRAGYVPADAMKDLADFYRMTGGRLPRLNFTTTAQSRSMASGKTGNLYVGSHFGKKTFYHELGHLLEGDPKLLLCAKEFLAGRRESDKEYALKQLTNGIPYGRDERAYKDSWFDPYVGKIYSTATEVFSMGMQMLASPEMLVSIMDKDPEHLQMMLGMCATRPVLDEETIQTLQKEVQEKKDASGKADDYLAQLDAAIAAHGKFWESHVEIEPYIRYGRKRPYSYTVSFDKRRPGSDGIDRGFAYFRSEKTMKRALYLWIGNGKPGNGNLSLPQIAAAFSYEQFPEELLSFPIPELRQR